MSRTHVSLLLAAAVGLWATPNPAAAAPVLRHQLLVNGDFALFGNTLAYDCGAGVPPVVGTVPTPASQCGANRGDSGVDVFWVSSTATSSAVASTANTAATSRSTAVLSIPPLAAVRYARIYWAAQSAAAAYDGIAQLAMPDGTVATLVADQGVAITVRGSEHWYQSSADVTALLQGLAEPRGPYTMSGVDSLDLVGFASETTFDAWWAVVFYQDPDDPSLRQLTLFDGLDYVEPNAPADVTVGGFLVPNGGFDAKLGVVTYEGDGAWSGDSLFFQGYRSVDPEPTVLTTLADALNGATNFFNGTRGWLGVAQSVAGDLPQGSGAAESMMSFDLDVVDLKALGAIGPGHDTARIRATSTLDVYALGAFVTSINTLKPSFVETEKTARNVTRPGADGVFAGDVIEYLVSTTNTGNDPSIQTVMEDSLPAGVTFVPGSLEIVAGDNLGTKTDQPGDDQAEYDTTARKIVVRVGNGANAFVGGMMNVGDPAHVVFRVTVDAGASGTLENQVQVSAGGLSGEPVRTFDSSPPGGGGGPTAFPVDACLVDAHCGGATPWCFTDPVPNACVGCLDDAGCGGSTPICELPAHVCVGATTIAPAVQQKTTVAEVAAPFAMTLTSQLGGPEVYDLEVTRAGGCTWPMELRNASSTLLGTFDAGGAWTAVPGGDTNGNGTPDDGETNGTSGFTLLVRPPAGSEGSICTATVTARGASSGLTASASATLRADVAATWTPSWIGTLAKAVSRGGSVGFSGVVQNNTAGDLSFTFGATVTTSPDAGPLEPWVVHSDPNGDGDPADGAPYAGPTAPVVAFGGTLPVVLVLRATTATGTPLPTGTILHAVATATGGSAVATQESEARVQYAATYADAARTLVRGRFAPCETVYLRAALLPSGTQYALEWYASAAPVRGVGVVRSVDPWPVSGGVGTDSLALAADAPGTWTVLVVEKTGNSVVDTVTLDVERAGAFASLSVPARVAPGSGLSVSAAVRDDNAVSTFAGSQLAYSVTDGVLYMDPAGAFTAAPSVAHLTSAVTVAPAATAPDAWSVGSVAWPSFGTYRVDAEWRVQCGPDPAIASTTVSFEVVPGPPVLADPQGVVSTRTPTFAGTALPGADVTVHVGAASCGPVAAGGGGAWACTLAWPLPDGDYVATAAQAISGATSDPSAGLGFTVDATPPDVAFSSPAPGALVGSPAAPGRTVAFSGTAEAGAAVTIASDGKSAAASRAGSTWTATITFDADGPYSAVAAATDAAGNSTTAELSFTIDTVPPAPPAIGFPADGALLGPGDLSGTFLTVTGTADPEAVVTVAIGAETRTATRTPPDRWSATFEPGEGTVTAAAWATDLAGNVSTVATSTFTIDTLRPDPPAFTSPLDGDRLSAAWAPEGIVTLAGTTDPETAVTVTVDGVPYAAQVAGGSWSLSLALDDGTHAASAVASDSLGNVSDPATIVFSIDAHAPGAPTLGVSSPTGAEPVPVGGSAERDSTVELFLDAVSAGTTTAAADGRFSFSLALVPEGSHALRATATDAFGNVSALSAPSALQVDRTAPGLATVGLESGAVFDAAAAPGGIVPLSGTSEMGSTVEVELDGAYVATIAGAPGGTWAASVALLDGQHEVRVRATDAVGNVGGWSAAALFTLDAHAPGAPALDPVASSTSGAVVTVAGTAELGATVTVWLDGAFVGTVTAAPGDGAFSLDAAVAEGLRAFAVTARDAVGNVSQPSTFSVRVDRSTAQPVIAPLGPPTNAAAVTVSGSAEEGATVTVLLDGAFAGTTTAAAAGFSLEVSVGEGVRTFTATAVDALGNASIASAPVTVTVDRSPPAPPAIDGPASGATVPPGSVVIHGTAEAGSTVSVTVNGATQTAIAADGAFSIAVTLPAGDWTASSTATDAAGNVSPPAERSFRAAEGGGPATGGGDPGGGGCGCSEAGEASPSVLLLLALVLAIAPRRRSRPA